MWGLEREAPKDHTHSVPDSHACLLPHKPMPLFLAEHLFPSSCRTQGQIQNPQYILQVLFHSSVPPQEIAPSVCTLTCRPGGLSFRSGLCSCPLSPNKIGPRLPPPCAVGAEGYTLLPCEIACRVTTSNCSHLTYFGLPPQPSAKAENKCLPHDDT